MKNYINQAIGRIQLAVGQKRTVFGLLFLLSGILLTSCEDVIDVKLSDET